MEQRITSRRMRRVWEQSDALCLLDLESPEATIGGIGAGPGPMEHRPFRWICRRPDMPLARARDRRRAPDGLIRQAAQSSDVAA